MPLDPRIGVLNSGKYYAFVHGYDQPETIGTLDEIEVALGLRMAPAAKKVASELKRWNVTMRFQYPSWDEVNGLEYRDITAANKSEANRIARRQAEDDGHACSGRGRYTFRAVEAN